MNKDDVADRLVNYSDAIVAFALVNSLAFLIALTERDVRCSLVDIQTTLWAAILAFPAVLTGALVLCRSAEVRLRASSTNQDVEAARALKYFHVARVIVIWVSILLCIPFIRMALSDTLCRATVA